MFTGIVEKTSHITGITRLAAGARLTVENPWTTHPQPGESISVSGACLTVVSANVREISFDVSPETLKNTIFSTLSPGAIVNLEKALTLGEDISGHFVTGHVDTAGRVVSVRRAGVFAQISFEVPDDVVVYLAPKGSVAVNGVSLTIASLRGQRFSVAVIPETLKRTNLASLSPGALVNIETDLLAKHVVRYLSLMRPESVAGLPLTTKGLEELGY